MEKANREILKTVQEGCDLNTKFDEESSIPEEFLDKLMNEFAYDPVRLSLTEDPTQMLYNRKTIEKIWDTQQRVVNPYTRQPFDINNSIPQIELRRQMRQYMENNQTLRLNVIPDYTEVLSESDMKDLLMNLISNFNCVVKIAHLKNGNMHQDLPRYWNALWRGFNLLRLYCQYREENRELFLSIRGYEYLFQVINKSLYDFVNVDDTDADAKEVCTEVIKIADVIGLEDRHLQGVPENSVLAFIWILHDVALDNYFKIRSSILRICFRNIDYFLQHMNSNCYLITQLPIELFVEHSYSEIVNEDLYHGTGILKAAWIQKYYVLESSFYVQSLVDTVVICISRFQEMHAIYIASQGTSSSERSRLHEVEKNIYLLITTLGRALFLIDCLIDWLIKADDAEDELVIESMEKLLSLDIVKDILQMVELILSGFKFLDSSHLQQGLNIIKKLYEKGCLSMVRRNQVIKTLQVFLRSDKVDMVDYKVIKLLLDDIELHAEA